MRRITLLSLWLVVLLSASDRVRDPLTNNDVICLVTAGFPERVVLTAVEMNRSAFDLSPDAIRQLRTAGVGETVISAMLKSTVSPTPHLGLLDPGVYVRKGEVYDLVNAEAVTWRVNQRARANGGTFTRLVIHGRVENPRSWLTVSRAAELLIVCPPGRTAAEYQLVRAAVGDDSREFRIDAAVRNGELVALASAEEIPVQTDNQFDLGVRLFVASLRAGEYGLVPPGLVADGRVVPGGIVYTFAIE